MGPALALHDSILARAVTVAGGTVVKTTGDGVMAVFPSVGACLAACLDAQEQLGSAEWPTPVPLRVRMGLTAGEVEEVEGDYHGPAVNRAARIMAAGHGGQVLVSGVAAALVGDRLPPGASLIDVGHHRLKDLTQPEHLYQLVHPSLTRDFPPLATLDARPHNLPMQVSEFFGRRAELAAARAYLTEGGVRLLTFTGPGGTGKTRLALQLAAEVADRFPGGTFFVDLSMESDPDSALEAIVRDVGLSGSREGAPIQVLKAKLAEQKMLLVLDNFEQVTAAAPLVAELLQHCPGLKVVVTSREALHVRGEQVLPITPLTVPDAGAAFADVMESEAVQLFAERARSARPDFELTPDNSAAIAEIAVRLDGLPLALELAAARLKVFSPSDLRDRLRQRTDVLGSGARDLPTRQRTLRSTIEWSYRLLDQDERVMFQLISIFPTARWEAVEAVVDATSAGLDPVETLASLVDKSLVRSVELGGSQRFFMLHTIQEFAREQLEADPALRDSARRAHAEYYARLAAGLAPALDGTERDLALERLFEEVNNLRIAWRYWVEAGHRPRLDDLLHGLWALYDWRGFYHGAAELASDLLGVLLEEPDSPARDQDELTLRISLGRAKMTIHGYTAEVEQHFERALQLSATARSVPERVSILRALATYYLNISNNDRVIAVGRELLDLAEEEQDDVIRVEAHLVYGIGTAFGGDLEQGVHHLGQAIERFSPDLHGSQRLRLGTSPGVVARVALGLLRFQSGWVEQAADLTGEAIEVARKIQHPFSLAYALYHGGFLRIHLWDYQAAATAATELEAISKENDYPVWRALASVLHGVALCGLGRPDEGLALTEAGSTLYEGLTTPPVFWTPLLALRSLGCTLAGKPQPALDLIDEAIGWWQGEETAFPEFRLQRGVVLAMLPDSDPAEVEESYRAAISSARIIGSRLIELAATTRLVELLRAGGGGSEEARDLAALYATFTEGFEHPELIMARTVLG
jgi:predicted ATPase